MIRKHPITMARAVCCRQFRPSLTKLGNTFDEMTIDDFAAFDEFHVGGRQATEHLIAQLDLSADGHVIDIGCGLGGAARFVADRYGCRVTGIDLTEETVQTGSAINRGGLDDRIDLRQGSAPASPFEAELFDVGTMIHVGMNIGDKAQLFFGMYRVLRTGALFGIYDIMALGDGELVYSVPWADGEVMSRLGTPHEYEEALQSAGFEVVTIVDRRDDALDFLEANGGRLAVDETPSPFGLHMLMGANRSTKARNMMDNLVAGLIAPMEIIARTR